MRDWDEHRLILALHRYGTLRAAGKALNVTHTTIARRLAALSADEPTAIFEKQGRAHCVTEYGLERVALAEQMEALDQAATRLQRLSGDGLSGPLSLSVPQAILDRLLLDDIHAFSMAHPNIDLTVAGSDQLADLDRGEADVVIRGHISPPDHLIGRRICTVGLHYYASKDYLKSTSPSERRWISLRQDSSWVAQSPYPDTPVSLIVNNIPSHLLMLSRGYGMGRAACFMADSENRLVRLSSEPATPRYGLWVLTHPDLKNSPKIKAVMQCLSGALLREKTRITGEIS